MKAALTLKQPEVTATIAPFLGRAGWSSARDMPLAGDASAWRYFRVTLANKTAVLMQALPQNGQTIVPLLSVAAQIESMGLSAPRRLLAARVGPAVARGFERYASEPRDRRRSHI